MSKIMIVDDDPNIRELVCVLLKNGGFEACEASDGRDALQKMTNENPDLAVVDLMMPNMDGCELCRKLRQYYENLPVLMRVRALLRRYKIETSQMIQIGSIVVDKNSYSVTIGGKHEDIPMKEFELLFKLAGLPGRTFSRDQLIEDIWGYDFEGNERTLDVHISRLRERFPSEQVEFKITTVRGLGYRLEVSP